MNLPEHGIPQMDIYKMNKTIDYYNEHADSYYRNTVGVDLDATRLRFAAYLPPEASVIDMGCGSGRDDLAFNNMGHRAIGLDASVELVSLAMEMLGIKAFCADMSTWISGEPYDGIWSCASLMHLNDEECKRFFNNLQYNLKSGGAIYISVKSGIETGEDAAGRYLRDYTSEEIEALISTVPGLQIREIWYTEDTLNRREFKWLNIIAVRL